MNRSELLLRQQIDGLLGFLEPLLSLANCHMVDFFINSSYKKFVPLGIQNEISEIGHEHYTDFLFKNEFRKAPHLKSFVENCEKFSLKNREVCLPVDDFMTKLESLGCDNVNRIKLEIFMSTKKSHEVEILSGAVASIAKLSNTSHLVDIGDGKGYLSSVLALHNKIPILGIDASNINTCGASKRANKLSKVWNGIPKAPHKSYPKKDTINSSKNIDLYKQITAFVDDSFDLEKLIVDSFNVSTSPRLGLVGLHTCGDLSPNSLKIFNTNTSVKFICNVGCCYHLLTERSDKNQHNYGFPMSQFLTERKTSIGRSARMIANQSVDRILDSKELPNVTIFYRALLQMFLERYFAIPTKHVGKFRKLPRNFADYARIAMKRLDVGVDISDQELEEFYSTYVHRLDELNVFYLLRCRLAPVIESLILLDRLLFLKEQGLDYSFLVRFFDPVVSPRCYGIVAFKEVLQ